MKRLLPGLCLARPGSFLSPASDPLTWFPLPPSVRHVWTQTLESVELFYVWFSPERLLSPV